MATMTGKRKQEETVQASEVRARWAELLQKVRFGGVTIRVRHYNKIVARIVADDAAPKDGEAA